MQGLKDKLVVATEAFENARKRLDDAREAYVRGPGRLYAETLAMEGKLASLSAEYEDSRVNAKAALEAAMLESAGVVTPTVTAVLTENRNAENLIEQSEMLRRMGERNRTAALVEVSSAAREYISAYEKAARKWAEMNVLGALVDCGERIARAMAVVPLDELLTPHRFRSDQHETVSMNLMFEELKTLRESFKDGARAYQRDIGVLDLGALNIGDILSQAQSVKASETLRRSQS